MASYSIQETRSGHPTLVFHDGKRDVRLHSAFDPVTEAGRAVAQFDPGKATVIVVCGLALAYHVEALIRMHPGRAVIAIEHDREVVAKALETHPGLAGAITAVTEKSGLSAALEEMDLSSFRGSAVYVHRPSHALYSDFYDEMVRDLAQMISSKLSDLLTRIEFEELWITNIFRNIHHMFLAAPVSSMFGRFKGYPGIIVSAGPSLRRNARELARAADRALIVCVDTAYKILLRHGITPHIVMTLDAQKHSVRHFLGAPPGRSFLLADLVSCPAILRDYPGSAIVSTTSKFYTGADGSHRRETTATIDWIESRSFGVGDIQSGGSVATSAFDLLLNLGCSGIVLAGQDLAYTGREIHCSGTHHNEEWAPRITRLYNLDTINQAVIRKRKIKRVEAFGGNGEVISDFVFDLYKSWFEDSAAKVPIPVINATEGGARIKNTVEKPLGEAIDAMPAQKISPWDILASPGGRPALSAAPPALIESIRRAEAAIASLHDAALRIIDGRDSGLALLAGDYRLDADSDRLIAPFLKRSHILFARRPDLPPEKAAALLAGNIDRAARKLLPALRDALKNLSRIA